ncbi:MAG: hypothetical protein ABEJ93_00495 [Candidatus Nanohalobium sp.]
MIKVLEKAALQGLIAAGTAYLIVQVAGFNSFSLTLIIYVMFIYGAVFELKNSLNLGVKQLLGNIVIVAEEEKKLKRLFKNKEYKVKGELEEI